MNNARYSIDDGPEFVRLNFTHTILNDAGVWMCDVRVVSERYKINDGNLIQEDSVIIGIPIQRNIQLSIIG